MISLSRRFPWPRAIYSSWNNSLHFNRYLPLSVNESYFSSLASKTQEVPAAEKSADKLVKEIKIDFMEDNLLLSRILQHHFDIAFNSAEMLIRKRRIWVLRKSDPEVSEPRSGMDTPSEYQRLKFKNSKINVRVGDRVFVKFPASFQRLSKSNKKASLTKILRSPPSMISSDFIPDRSEHDYNLDITESIIYKDKDILILNKPENIPVHSGHNSPLHLKNFFHALKLNEYEEEPRNVHRLDKRTSGALILARNRKAASILSAAFRKAADGIEDNSLMREYHSTPSLDAFGNKLQIPDDPEKYIFNRNEEAEILEENSDSKMLNELYPISIDKTYWALLTDIPERSSGTIDKHLFITPESDTDISNEYNSTDFQEVPSNHRVLLRHPSKVSPYHHKFIKRAITRYQVIQTIGRKGAWVRLMPLTGRKHQLRAHCASALHAPILGDFKYGIPNYKKLIQIGWGQIFDFTKWNGLKQLDQGMPMFLHLRQIVIKNYFMHLGGGGKGVDGYLGRKEIAGSNLEGKADLVLTAGIPDMWKATLRQCGLDSSLKV